MPGYIQFCMGFSFPNLIIGFLDNLLYSYQSLFLPSVGSFFMFEFVHDLFVHSHRPFGIFAWLSLCCHCFWAWRWSLNINLFSWTSLSSIVVEAIFHGSLPGRSLKNLLFWSPEWGACWVPSLLLLGSCTPSCHGHCNPGCPWASHLSPDPPCW